MLRNKKSAVDVKLSRVQQVDERCEIGMVAKCTTKPECKEATLKEATASGLCTAVAK